MTIQEQQSAILMKAKSREGKNQYTQGSKRLQVATGYSDCSSFARWPFLVVSGVDIGLNTDAQVTDKDMVTVHQGGKAPDLALLQVGDLIYFKGNSDHTYGVQHVEMLITLGETLDKCKTIGHNSGMGPTVKNFKSYLDGRTKSGKGYLMTRRPVIREKTWVLGERELSIGCYGEDVGELQKLLVQQGYSVGKSGVDMDFGPDTRSAVKSFQKDNGLDVDGIVGPDTLGALTADEPEPVPEPGGDTRDGCDVSHHDGKIEWSKVTAPYVFIRVQDNTVLDRELSANVKGAKKYGVPYGHYAFFEATNEMDAQEEVQLFVQRMKDVGSNPSSLILDVEQNKNTVGAVKAGLKELKKLWPDVQHGIYIAHQLYEKFEDLIPMFDMVWIPRYNKWKTPPAYPYDLWQGGYGSFPGIQNGKSAVDCNRLRKGLTWSDLIALRAK